jgi:uncharacterized membrane protein YphA (DoxX/SURF4 family)
VVSFRLAPGFFKLLFMEKAMITTARLQKRNIVSRTGNSFLKIIRQLANRATIVQIICSLLIVLFIYAGLSKLLNYQSFRFELGRSPFITKIAGFVAWSLPTIELVISILLVIKKTRLLGLYASFFLMVLFTGYIYMMLHYSPFLPCSCGGILSSMSWSQHFYFNILFTCLALIGALLDSKKQNGFP